jgi:hypothetical protein
MTLVSWHPFRRSRWKRTFIIGTLAAVLSLVGLAGSGAAAQAATGLGAKSVTFKVELLRTPSGQLQTLSAHHGAVAPDEEIVTNFCTTQVNNPHASGHNPENVNVTGTTICAPYPVDESYLDIELYYDGEDYAYGQNYEADTFSNQVNAATTCLNGTYYAELEYTIYFGPTWTPDEASGDLISNIVNVTC